MAVSEQLLADVKIRLGITWQDELTDKRIAGLIEDGQAYLDNKIGVPGYYDDPGYARTLLMEYVRYARDEALDVFEQNYLALLLAARDERRVRDYAEGEDSAIPPANS